MALSFLNKYVWLVDTIYRHKYISYEKINELWLDDERSEGLEIPKRTFHTWIREVEEMFGFSICCERVGEVLEPLWLRKEIAGKVKQMWNHYKK